ncbi:hypothetical protein [Haloferula sp. BvORR071]|uniref:hypothetical protein n=1 Tax=Haloferula sp. BvORR071 TaxID=1396141 RepID=UPI000552D73D|nr:hypothetical protein [Haloferula sp. BvORR071]
MAFAVAGLALVGTIEVLNCKCGNAIARKMAQEPHSKWRILAPRSAWLLYQRDFKALRGINPQTPLSAANQEAFEAYAQSRWRAYLPYYWLDYAMKYSIWGMPAGLCTAISSFILLGRSRSSWRALLWTTGIVGIMTFLTVAIRYFPALGW